MPPARRFCCPSFRLYYLLCYKLAKCSSLMLLHGLFKLCFTYCKGYCLDSIVNHNNTFCLLIGDYVVPVLDYAIYYTSNWHKAEAWFCCSQKIWLFKLCFTYCKGFCLDSVLNHDILLPDWWLCRTSFGLCYLLYYKLAQSRSLILLRGKTLVLQAVFYLGYPDMILQYNFLPWIPLFDHYSLPRLLKGRGLNTFVYKPQFSDKLIDSHLNSVWTRQTIARQL